MSAKNSQLRSYVAGFLLSAVLTLTAYYLVVNKTIYGWSLIYAVMALAVVQLAVQLIFFLHLRHEKEPRWNLLVFDFMMLVLAVLVIGSLWIMKHLSYHTMSPSETDTYLLEEEGIVKQ